MNESVQEIKPLIDHVIKQTSKIIVGKENVIRLAVNCLLSHGHLLIEDLPGMGKTTLAQTLSRVLGLDYKRIQFTSDMLPADILGTSVYNREHNNFSFHRGPIFSQLVLADEINRATPRAQSALLEAMEERQVTIDNETLKLPHPFFVIATQNPSFQIGTFPLPESQIDRFMMKIKLGYPDRQAERTLLNGNNRHDMIAAIESILDMDKLINIQQQVGKIYTSENLLDYIQAILGYSRDSGLYHTGLSPRAGLALLHSARAWALMDGRDHVIPEDVQAVLVAVTNHRLILIDSDENSALDPCAALLEVAIP